MLMKELVKLLGVEMATGKTKQAETLLAQGLSQDADKCVKAIRKSGIFRMSRYEYESKVVRLLAEGIKNDHCAGLQDESRDYIQSVLALASIAPSVASSFKAFQKSINARSFKSYLIAVELLFREKPKPPVMLPSEFGVGRSKEELSEAFSYYFSLLMEKCPPSIEDINALVERKVGSKFYLDKLRELADVICFREAEMLVHAFPYIATTVGRETIVEARDPFFEKSVRLGYIKSDEQREADRMEFLQRPRQSLREMAKAYVNSGDGHYFELVREGPNSRVRDHWLYHSQKFFSKHLGTM